MRAALLLILLALYGALDVRAIAVWRGELPLWRQALSVAPGQDRAVNNYAKARVAAGDRAWLTR